MKFLPIMFNLLSYKYPKSFLIPNMPFCLKIYYIFMMCKVILSVGKLLFPNGALFNNEEPLRNSLYQALNSSQLDP